MGCIFYSLSTEGELSVSQERFRKVYDVRESEGGKWMVSLGDADLPQPPTIAVLEAPEQLSH